MKRGVTAFLAGLMMLAALPAQAANWLEQHIYMIGPRYDAVVPACDYGLGVIASRFATKEGRFWNSGLTIQGFEKVRQVAFHPWANDTIPRRFCTATAIVSDGRKWSIVQNVPVNEFSRSKIVATENELKEEKALVAELLG